MTRPMGKISSGRRLRRRQRETGHIVKHSRGRVQSSSHFKKQNRRVEGHQMPGIHTLLDDFTIRIFHLLMYATLHGPLLF